MINFFVIYIFYTLIFKNKNLLKILKNIKKKIN